MDIDSLKKDAAERLRQVASLDELEKLRIEFLGREQGKINVLLRGLKDLALAEKQQFGPMIQALRIEVEAWLLEKKRELEGMIDRLSGVDYTVPGKKIPRGHRHPLSIADEEIRKIFSGMNFSIVDGPEVESDYYNFDSLNFPPSHPAREMQDTFWLPSGYFAKDVPQRLKKSRHLLRTHVSNVQVRHMEKHTPPFQVLYPGRVYRNEAIDAGHEVNFYQSEGMVVGKNITIANFKFVIEEFFRKFYGDSIEFRYRPSYFPFVEPGIEIDIKLKGKWFEIMGAGMIHPRVFEYAHLNPHEWQGFAFGMGLDRLTMIKYGITDVRLFYSGDLRFIRQF